MKCEICNANIKNTPHTIIACPQDESIGKEVWLCPRLMNVCKICYDKFMEKKINLEKEKNNVD